MARASWSDRLRGLLPAAAVVGLLGLAAFASAHSSLGVGQVADDDLPLPEQEISVEPREPRDFAGGEPAHVPDWLTTALLVVCLLALAALLGWLLWLVVRSLLRRMPGRGPGRAARTGRPHRRPAPSSSGTTEEVVAALDAGLDDLSDTDADPRRAVIACWVRLEQAAAAAGIDRRVGDTPTDLVTRMLAGGPDSGATVVSADVLADFAEVYRQARYATRAVDENMRGRARAALHRLRAELTPEAPRP